MPLNSGELRTRLKANLHNDVKLTDPDDFNIFLNLGMERIVRDSPHTLGIKRATLSLTDAARDYDLASDFYQMATDIFISSENAVVTAKGLHRWINEVEYQETVPSGTPEEYCVTGINSSTAVWQVSFDRTPSTAMTAYYWYRWMPAAISGTATSTPVISALGFGELLLWAATVAGRTSNDPEGLAEAEALYQKHLKEYRCFDPQQPARIPVWGTSQQENRHGGLLDPAHFAN
jgi:hypothetical protein